MTHRTPRQRAPRISERQLRELLGEAVHTGFRKGSDHPSADRVWLDIRQMPVEEWAKVVDWIAWSLFYGR